MNEFEWHRQMRALREPVTPQRDLWARIEVAMDQPVAEQAPPVAARASRRQGWLLAASFAGISLLAVSLNLRVRHEEQDMTPVAVQQTVEAWKPNDPRLAGAAVELDAAQMELRQAMQQAPHSPSLQRLLDRTEKRQSQLRQLEHQAS
ncbi:MULTISPECIES: hypothetical protein [Dyella]|uniref:Uncharacterized protein n=2 Tax=Dyella TaxID=231454 RepID=A0A4R0YRZ2_9GAMM|nr:MULTISPECIES: hypothetical protein [Dyella]TBR40325.1 hypothetical protein EYV96_09235 [Dyella terrae]TCI12093.1 hypothetical protein EZM97_01635 [Dyella soli]